MGLSQDAPEIEKRRKLVREIRRLKAKRLLEKSSPMWTWALFLLGGLLIADTISTALVIAMYPGMTRDHSFLYALYPVIGPWFAALGDGLLFAVALAMYRYFDRRFPVSMIPIAAFAVLNNVLGVVSGTTILH